MSQFIISGFSDEIATSFDEQLRVIHDLGMGYIEIRGVDGKSIADCTGSEIKDIKDKLDQADISVSAIGSPIGKIHIEDDFAPHFERFKHVVDIARSLDTKFIRIFSFFMEADKASVYRDEVMRRMQAFCDYVEGSDIILLHENEKDIYGDTAERCLDIYETMQSDHLRLIFDPANFVQCGVETYPHAYEMLNEHVIYYHIKDAMAGSGKVVPSGHGDGHIRDIIKVLHQSDYNGFLSLEPHLGHFMGFSELEDQKAATGEKSDANKFKLALDSLMGIVNEVQNG